MNSPALGIDMGKGAFDAALMLQQTRALKARFDNTPAGFRKLRTWLKQHGVGKVRVAIESTNTFADRLLEWLFAEGHAVFLLNPERVAQYGRALGRRNKTDTVDADTIASFIAHHDATPWQPPSPEQKTLRALTRTRYQLVTASVRLVAQLQTAEAAGRAHLQAVLHKIRERLRKIGVEIAQHLRTCTILGEQVRRLMTIKGVGRITAATLIAELPPITDQTDPRTICGWAGLTPRRRQSSKKEWRTRISRKGNAYIRHALYMPALVAKRYNPLFADFAARLKTNPQRTNGAVLGAISHKMLRIAVGLLRSHTDFDPNWSHHTP